MNEQDRLYLHHILENLAKISHTVADVDKPNFMKDVDKQDAVLRRLEVIGEATKRLSQAFRQKHTHIPWRAIAGMRDKLIHDYLDVDLEEVWKTIVQDVPFLEDAILKILDSQP